eukprot:scaffold644220_cov27-Prasinocladus_malaysianus.AAC.1
MSLGGCFREQPADLHAPELRALGVAGVVDRELAGVVLEGVVGALGEQLLDQSHVAALDGDVQRRPA